MTTRIAACTCGDLQLACTGEPRRVSLCHCLDCQRRTGSLFSIAAFYERGAVTVLQGRPAQYTRSSASGQPVTFHFCPLCGSTVYWEPQRLPHLVGIAVGAFADPGFPAPEQAVWCQDQHTWFCLPAGIPCHQRNPPPRG
jgi:hypothetical protein